MSFVKNKPDTSYQDPPNGYGSWIDYWESKKGRPASSCANTRCSNEADCGAHVIKADGYDRSTYIVPLCSECNNYNNNSPFDVNDSDLLKIY
jgi:hypothetical protein